MTPVSDTLLLASVAGVLDPGRQDELSARLARDPALAARRDRLATELGSPARRPQWTLPPVGVWGRPQVSAASARPVLHLEAGAGLRPGNRVRLTVPTEGWPADTEVVVLWRGDGDWQRVLPTPGAPGVPVAVLQGQAGAPALEVVVQPSAAHQRWAVVLVPTGVVADWAAPEAEVQQALQRAIMDERASATVVGFDVTLG